MRYLITAALLATALALPLGSPAAAQSADVIAQCARTVGQMKFEGWPADRNREMMMSACQQNGGVIPGARQESPVSLRNAPARQR